MKRLIIILLLVLAVAGATYVITKHNTQKVNYKSPEPSGLPPRGL